MAARIIAITGASGSGKTYLTDGLFDALRRRETNLAVIREDSYYRAQSQVPMSRRITTNYDHPDSLEHELLAEHLRCLKNGEAIEVPEYDYTVHDRKSETCEVRSGQLILVEGILLLSNPELRKQFDATLFVETPLDICFERRLARDTVERGRTEESVVTQFESTVKPMYHRFIEPSKQHAQFVISGEQKQDAMMAELFCYLEPIIAEFSREAKQNPTATITPEASP